MKHSILLIDLVNEGRCESIFSMLESSDLDANILRCESDQDIEAGIDSIDIAGLIISIDNYSDRLDRLLRDFQTRVGALPEFIMIICDEPSPRFLVSLFEFGIETIKAFNVQMRKLLGG